MRWKVTYDPVRDDKECLRCGVRKHASLFYKKSSGAGGIDSFCIECFTIKKSNHRNTPIGRENHRINARLEKERYPHKVAARTAVNLAILRGDIIVAKRCEICGCAPEPNRRGTGRLHAHHDDYSDHFKVRWLCVQCHAELHKTRVLDEPKPEPKEPSK